jgi:hypothetical protein
MRVENQTKLESEKTRVYSKKSRLKWSFSVALSDQEETESAIIAVFSERRQN